MKQIVVLFIFIAVAFTSFAEPKSNVFEISGVITEKVNGEVKPIPYATVCVKGSTESTFADADGVFVIAVEKGTQDLQISCFGYETALAKVKAKKSKANVLKVSLAIKDNSLVQK